MALTFGAVASQYDGEASNGDPTDGGPGRYSGPKPGSCNDGAAVAGTGLGSSGGGTVHVLWAEAIAVSGPNAAQAASAHSFNKVASPMLRTKAFTQQVLAYFGWPGPRLDVTLDVSAGIDDGPANVRVVVWLRTQAGAMVANLQHSYDLTKNAADPTRIDIARDGAPWQSMSNPDSFIETFSFTDLPLPNGAYTYQSELNVTARADGRVRVRGHSVSQLTE